VRRAAVLELPVATLTSAELRAAVIERAPAVLTWSGRKALPRILTATNRALALVDRPVAARLVATTRSLRWVERLEQIPAARLKQAVGDRQIVLSRGVTLRLVPEESARATLVLRRR
jgi:hypothetical protein